MINFILVILIFLGTVSNLRSAEKSVSFSMGLGAAVKNNIRKNNSYSGKGGDVVLNTLPIVQIVWGPIMVGQQGLTANVLGNREVAWYFNINRAGDRYQGVGMVPRKESWFFGAGVKYHKFNFFLSRDVDGRSHGVKTLLNYTALYSLADKWHTRSSMGIECYNRSFAEYYYGVRSYETNNERNEYHPKSYCAPVISFLPTYKKNDSLSFITGVSFKGIADAVRKSPTTKDGWLEVALILGGMWKF